MDNLKLEVTKAEADYILNTLATRPSSEVFQFIAKIQGQFQAQVMAPIPAAPEESKNEAV